MEEGMAGCRELVLRSHASRAPCPLLLCLAALSLLAAAPHDGRAAEDSAPALELDLRQCIEMALRHNASLQAVREESEAAKARTRSAFAEYLPKLTLTAQYTRLDDVRSFSTRMDRKFRDVSLDTAAWWGIAETAGTAAANATYDNRDVDPMQTFNRARAQAASQFPAVPSEPILGQDVLEAHVLLTQPLFTGGKIRHGHKMAALDEEIRHLAVGVREDEVVLEVTNAYLGAVASRRIREELVDLGAGLGVLRDATQGSLDAGSDMSSARDLAQVEVTMAANQQGVAESRRAEEVALSALRRLMGLDDAQPLKLTGAARAGVTAVPTLQACEALAARRRPEMAQIQTARQLRDHGVSRAKASFAPDIAAFAGFGYIADDADFANPNDSEEWFAGLSMTLPIFTGFSRFAKVREARSNLRQAVWMETQVRRAIRLQVDEAHYSVQAALQKLAAAERMVEAATRLKTITTAARAQHIGADYRRMLLLADEPEIMEFKVVPDVPEELDAEIMETTARIARIAVELELRAARARLARAIGVRSLEDIENETDT